ncbi:MAG TPA: VOC family protein [Dehalococcoidia bacterium]|nr:VOC family protein [Dehalococcoidia bacterium]
MIKSFSHIYLPSRDVDEAIAFYTQKLGFSLLRKYKTGERPSAYVELGEILLELTPSTSTPSVEGRSELRIGLVVDDMDATLAELRSKGVEVAREPWQALTFWGRQAQIKDPSGYLISLREWRQPDGPRFAGWQPESPDVVRLG